jgi:hypothetical protein
MIKNPVDRVGRGNDGKFTHTAETAERDAQACHLRARGNSYATIAREMGFADGSAAYKSVQRGLKAIVAEPAEEVRRIELIRLDGIWQAAQAVLEANHFVISEGRVVRLAGAPLMDDAPVLAAIDRLIKVQERRAKLLGLDAPVKREITISDGVDAEIRNLAEQLRLNDPETEDAAEH